MDNAKKTINATNNSLGIISEIKSQDGARLADIVDNVELSRSAVHSHLNTLREHGYVTKEGEVYHLGLKLFHLGQYSRTRTARYRLAEKKTRELGEKLNHAIDFDVEIEGNTMTLFHEANKSTEVGLNEGEFLPVHASATGKAILAEVPDKRVAEIIDRRGMPAETEYTITDRQEFQNELKKTKERGYAIIDQEWLEGLRAVGVVVKLWDGSPFGALSAGGPTYRLTKEAINSEIAPVLIEAADELEENIRAAVLN